MLDALLLSALHRYASLGTLLLRVCVGGFLIQGAVPSFTDSVSWTRSAISFAGLNLPFPQLVAHLSVSAQLLCGSGLVLGFCTRWSGLVCAIHSAVALVVMHRHIDAHYAFHNALLMTVGIHLMFQGSGRYGLDAWLERSRLRRFDAHY